MPSECKYVYQRGEYAGYECGQRCAAEYCYRHKKPTFDSIQDAPDQEAVEGLMKRAKTLSKELKKIQSLAKKIRCRVQKESPLYKDLRKIRSLDWVL